MFYYLVLPKIIRGLHVGPEVVHKFTVSFHAEIVDSTPKKQVAAKPLKSSEDLLVQHVSVIETDMWAVNLHMPTRKFYTDIFSKVQYVYNRSLRRF